MCEMDQWIDAAVVPDHCGDEGAELEGKLTIFQAIYVSNLIYGRELCVMTKRMRLWIQATKMSFLCRVSGLSLRDRVRGLEGAWSRDTAPSCRKGASWGCSGIWSEWLLGGFLWSCCGHIQLAGDPRTDSELAGGNIQPIWPGNASGSPRWTCGEECLECPTKPAVTVTCPQTRKWDIKKRDKNKVFSIQLFMVASECPYQAPVNATECPQSNSK